MIDLHMHSVFSDGSKTPEELVELGASAGLRAMALTDHDTVSGVERFLAAARQKGIQAVSGVEVSAEVDGGTLHMLGYGVDHRNAEFCEQLRWVREGRTERNREIIHKLNRLGIRITEEEVLAAAGEEVIGRPHIAKVLIQKGVVRSKKEAFDRFLARGKPAYAERRRLDVVATIKLIQFAGGLAVIAHPYALKLSPKDLRDFVRTLRDAGLAGIEVYYSEHTPEMTRQYKELAEELGLLMTGGTDYHGDMTPDIALGRGMGNLHVPDAVWERLNSALSASKQP